MTNDSLIEKLIALSNANHGVLPTGEAIDIIRQHEMLQTSDDDTNQFAAFTEWEGEADDKAFEHLQRGEIRVTTKEEALGYLDELVAALPEISLVGAWKAHAIRAVINREPAPVSGKE